MGFESLLTLWLGRSSKTADGQQPAGGLDVLRRRVAVPPCGCALLTGLPAPSDCEITLGHAACKTYYTVMAQKRPDRPTQLKQRGMTQSLCEPLRCRELWVSADMKVDSCL